MNATLLNQQLSELYFDKLPSIYNTIREHATSNQLENMNGPFMMDVQPEYLLAAKKLMFVGMETHGWRKCNLEEALSLSYQNLIDCHKDFMAQEKPINSPFWWFMRDLNSVYQKSDLRKTVLWTNLSKIDISKSRPTGKLFDNTMAGFIDLLLEEVKIVKPDVMILMTSSPNYQWHMNENFGLTSGLAQREVLIPNQLFKWTSDQLPANTFQICHPNRLRFSKGGYKENAESIIKKISALTL
jgi:hypothetical protein